MQKFVAAQAAYHAKLAEEWKAMESQVNELALLPPPEAVTYPHTSSITTLYPNVAATTAPSGAAATPVYTPATAAYTPPPAPYTAQPVNYNSNTTYYPPTQPPTYNQPTYSPTPAQGYSHAQGYPFPAASAPPPDGENPFDADVAAKQAQHQQPTPTNSSPVSTSPPSSNPYHDPFQQDVANQQNPFGNNGNVYSK